MSNETLKKRVISYNIVEAAAYDDFVFCHKIINCNIVFSWHTETL